MRRGPWIALAALVGLSWLLRGLAGARVHVPWLAGDEVIYSLLGQSLWRHGELAILGGPTGFLSLVYPLIAGLPLSFSDLELGYSILKAVQPLVMSLAAVPVYLWARSLSSSRWALAAAALTLAIPGLTYSELVMTEVAFYPLMALAAWAMASALGRPTLRNQGFVVGAILLASATRLQAIVLLPVFVTAVLLEAALDRRSRALVRLWPVFVGLATVGCVWIGWRLASGGSWTGLLGAYGSAATGYDTGRAARFVLYHAADALLLVGVAPACAVALLLLGAARRREPRADVRAYLAVAASLFVWLVVEVGIFASEHAGRLAERDLLALAPVFFVGLALWLGRSAPRPFWRTAWIALGALVAVYALPLDRLLDELALVDDFNLIALFRQVGPDHYRLAVLCAAAVAVLMLAFLPTRLLLVLPLALVAAFAYASVEANREVWQESALQQTRLLGPDRRWIDEADAGRAAFLYDGNPYWTQVWENLFFNRRLRWVYDLPGTKVPGPLPQRSIELPASGRVDLPTRYLVASSYLVFDGDEVARAPLEGIGEPALVLWRLREPARLLTRVTGLRENGDVYGGAAARLTAYGCRGGEFRLTIFAKQPETVEISRNGRPVRTLQLSPPDVFSESIPARGSGGICTFQVATTGLLGTTQFEFIR